MTLETGSTLGRYRLVRELGRGGMGVVWEAIDPSLDREVALKVLAPEVCCDVEHLARFEREARTLASLNHPNIVTIHSIESDGDDRFLTMERVHGRPLDALLPRGGFDAPDLFRLAVPLTDAIAAAHRRGVTHRDLKPGNVLITDDGQVKVLDFGLALSAEPVVPATTVGPDGSESVDTETYDGRISGTLHYMAPEQLHGRSADPRTDVFALGVLLYQMALGRRPFHGTNAPDLIASILRDRPTPIANARPELPRHFSRVVERCLEKDPALRPSSAAELRDELRALARDLRPGHARGTTSIAVLPFDDMTPARDHDWLCEGIAEEILNALARLEGLRVASRTSSFQFRGKTFDSREIGDRLGVDTLLEGGVRRAGDRLRITVQLVGGADGYRMWSERFDRDLDDVFALQDDIAQAVVRALELNISPRERRAMRQANTEDARAYEDYLRARTLYARYDRHGVTLARTLFRQALDRDPSYAPAWAGLSDCCAYLYMNVEHDEALRREADEASRNALDLDPDVPETHIARGLALSINGLGDEARRHFEAALRLAPRSFDAHYWYARSSFEDGRLEEAVRLFEEAARLCPTDYQSLLLVAQIHESLDRAAEARDVRERGVAIVDRRLEIEPNDVRALYMGANGRVALGDLDRGLDMADRARDLAPDDTMVLYNLGCIYALAGRADDALGCLEHAVGLGFSNLPWLEQDGNLDPLRETSRFRALLERLAAAPPPATGAR